MRIGLSRYLRIAALAAATAAGAAQAAGPLIAPGDRLLRRDIETLKAYGLIEGPINTWPLAWEQVTAGLTAAADAEALPPHVLAAAARLRRQAPEGRERSSFWPTGRVQITNDPRLIRDFGGGARADGDLQAGFESTLGRFFARLSVGYRSENPTDEELHFDNSFIAMKLGNWFFFGGTMDQWYGPGVDTAQVLSTNARPSPRVGVQRYRPTEIDLPVLRWLGPLQFNFTASRAEDGRDDFDKPWLFWTRLSFEPIKAFTIAASRGLQICGERRPCNGDTFLDAFLAASPFFFDDLDNTGDVSSDDEPGNQIFGLDFTFAGHAGGLDYKLFLESVAEDSSGPVAFGAATLSLGGHVGGYLDGTGWSWRLRGEATETQTNRFFGIGKDDRQGVAFNNFVFTEGYTFRDGFIGPSIGGDGRLFTGEFSLADARARHYYLRYRHIVLNATGLQPQDASFGRRRFTNRLSRNPERINSVQAGAFLPTRWGKWGLEARLFDDQPNTPGRGDFHGAVELRWSYGF